MSNPRLNPDKFFTNYEDASAPLSAGTYTSYICQECPDENGVLHSTIALDTPHPVYTNEMGKEVIQLQMVTLGGMFGLNS